MRVGQSFTCNRDNADAVGSFNTVVIAHILPQGFAHHKQNWPRPVQGLEEVLTMYSNRTEKLLLVAAGCAAGLLGCLTLLLIIAVFA